MIPEKTSSIRALDAASQIKAELAAAGTPIGPSDTAVAGHAIGAGDFPVTNNMREFAWVPGLTLKNCVKQLQSDLK